jgi:hypothetical protein
MLGLGPTISRPNQSADSSPGKDPEFAVTLAEQLEAVAP